MHANKRCYTSPATALNLHVTCIIKSTSQNGEHEQFDVRHKDPRNKLFQSQDGQTIAHPLYHSLDKVLLGVKTTNMFCLPSSNKVLPIKTHPLALPIKTVLLYKHTFVKVEVKTSDNCSDYTLSILRIALKRIENFKH